MSNKLMSIQLCSLNLPNIPPRSSLYCLEPVGIGTPLVESLSSYISRLAQEHCLYPTTLIHRYIAPTIEEDCPGYFKVHRTEIANFAGRLNSNGNTAYRYVAALEKHTLRTDLRFLTLLTFSDILASRGLSREHRHWCPICYEEWHSKKLIIYEPLLWLIDIVNVCPFHGSNLQFLCPHCYQKVPILKQQSVAGYCSNCKGWLGSSSLKNYVFCKEIAKDQAEWEFWVSDKVGCLLSSAPNFSSRPSTAIISQKVSAYVQEITSGSKMAFAAWLGVPKRIVNNAVEGRTLLLRSLLRILYCLNVSPLEFLRVESNFEVDVSEQSLTELQFKSPYQPKSQRKHDSNEVKIKLEKFLQMHYDTPPSLKEVSTKLEIDATLLRRYAPDLCRAISQRYLSFKKECASQNLQRACEEVRQIVNMLHLEGQIPARRYVEERMSMPGYLRYKEVINAFYEERHKLGF